jgi:hypothetical protein
MSKGKSFESNVNRLDGEGKISILNIPDFRIKRVSSRSFAFEIYSLFKFCKDTLNMLVVGFIEREEGLMKYTGA